MIKPDPRDHTHILVPHHIRRIEPPAKSRLQDHHIRILLCKPQLRNQKKRLEIRRTILSAPRLFPDLVQQPAERLLRDLLPVKPDPLPRVHQMRRREQRDMRPCREKHLRQILTYTALPVRPRNMRHQRSLLCHPLIRCAQPVQKRPRLLQPMLPRKPRKLLQILHCLRIFHDRQLSLTSLA